MNILAELCGDMKFIVQYRKKHVRLQKDLDRHPPKREMWRPISVCPMSPEKQP